MWVGISIAHADTCTTLSPGFLLGWGWDMFPFKGPRSIQANSCPHPTLPCYDFVPLKQFSDTVHSYSHTRTCTSSCTHTPHTPHTHAHTHTHAQTYHTHMHHTHIIHTHTYTHTHIYTSHVHTASPQDDPSLTLTVDQQQSSCFR